MDGRPCRSRPPGPGRAGHPRRAISRYVTIFAERTGVGARPTDGRRRHASQQLQLAVGVFVGLARPVAQRVSTTDTTTARVVPVLAPLSFLRRKSEKHTPTLYNLNFGMWHTHTPEKSHDTSFFSMYPIICFFSGARLIASRHNIDGGVVLRNIDDDDDVARPHGWA